MCYLVLDPSGLSRHSIAKTCFRKIQEFLSASAPTAPSFSANFHWLLEHLRSRLLSSVTVGSVASVANQFECRTGWGHGQEGQIRSDAIKVHTGVVFEWEN